MGRKLLDDDIVLDMEFEDGTIILTQIVRFFL